MDLGRIVKIHEDVPARRTEPEIVSVPVRPSERAARRRKLWEGPQPAPEKEPVRVPARVPEKEGA